MATHDEFLQLSALATSGELTEEERKKLETHLLSCASCRQAIKDYETAAGGAVRALACDFPAERMGADPSWSVEKAETAFFERLKKESPQPEESSARENSELPAGRRLTYRPSRIRWREIWMPFAACVLLALALGIAGYRMGVRRGTEVTQAIPSVPTNSTVSLQEQMSDAGHEHAALVARLTEESTIIGELQRELGEQKALLNKLKTAGGEVKANTQPTQAVQSEKEPRSKSTEEYEAAQLRLDIQFLLKLLQPCLQRQQAGTRAAALEGKVEELSQGLRDREHTVDQQQAEISKQQELLDHDRDIRELMGARDLYIAEVYDVAKTGQTNKTYGRVFYTKGKSLIFYAYDLDEQPGIKNASSFQAWGRTGPDKKQARNLGVFYEDNVGKKRWILKFDDPKTLDQIDAVFVTVEPIGGSHRPSGKPLLFAYLRVNPNHP
ncbi:MAG TPA: zf-HC2 domain-containing protein [Candidatus Dormibacteraeota bacterium]|nr:zf-HC2 domain-containing protein [Candidatus Dormibacteraeota bacterium]